MSGTTGEGGVCGPAAALTRCYWQGRYREGSTGWDRGVPSPTLEGWLRDGTLAPCRILVPGCGRGHEVVADEQRGSQRKEECEVLRAVLACVHPRRMMACSADRGDDAQCPGDQRGDAHGAVRGEPGEGQQGRRQDQRRVGPGAREGELLAV